VAAVNGTTIYVDCIQFEEGDTATPYCDGDQPNCRWTGTAHASTSERIGPIPNAVSSNITLAQPGIGDGKPAMLFDGASSYVNIYSTQLADAFNPAEFTIQVWFRVADAAVWADGTERTLLHIGADANNFIAIRKPTDNNQIDFVYKAGGTEKKVSATSYSETGWGVAQLAVSATGDSMVAMLDGVQVDTESSLGTWAGAPVSTLCCLGAASTAAASPWKGWLQHVPIWNTPLSVEQMAYQARVR